MGIGDALGIVDRALKASYELATAEQKELLADARNSLADLKTDLADLKEENRELRAKIANKEQMIPDPGHQWLKMQNDPDSSRRYCQVCYYVRDRVMPLNAPEEPGEWHSGYRFCPACKDYRGK